MKALEAPPQPSPASSPASPAPGPREGKIADLGSSHRYVDRSQEPPPPPTSTILRRRADCLFCCTNNESVRLRRPLSLLEAPVSPPSPRSRSEGSGESPPPCAAFEEEIADDPGIPSELAAWLTTHNGVPPSPISSLDSDVPDTTSDAREATPITQQKPQQQLPPQPRRAPVDYIVLEGERDEAHEIIEVSPRERAEEAFNILWSKQPRQTAFLVS